MTIPMRVNRQLLRIKLKIKQEITRSLESTRVQPHPSNFWFGENPDKITENPGKICGNFGKICENVSQIAVCALILQKWHPKSKCRRFFSFFFWNSCFYLVLFGQVRVNMGENGAWSVLSFKKIRPTWKEMQLFFFRSFSLEFFSGKFGEIWAKIPRILKNFLAPTLMFKRTVFSYLNVQALVPGVCNRCLIALVDISDVCSFFFKWRWQDFLDKRKS